MALPGILRLPRRQFLLVKFSGNPVRQKHFSALVKRRSPSGFKPNRYSVVVSSKVHRLAVKRNQLRRLIYQELSQRTLSLFLDMIIYPQKSMLNLTHAEISHEIDTFVSALVAQKP